MNTSEGLWEVDLCSSITPVLSYLHSVKFLLCLHGGIIRRIIVEINRLQDCSTKIFIHGQCHGSLHRSGQQNDVREKPLYGNQVGIHLHALCGYNRPCTNWQERTFALSPYVATNLFLMSSRNTKGILCKCQGFCFVIKWGSKHSNDESLIWSSNSEGEIPFSSSGCIALTAASRPGVLSYLRFSASAMHRNVSWPSTM